MLVLKTWDKRELDAPDTNPGAVMYNSVPVHAVQNLSSLRWTAQSYNSIVRPEQDGDPHNQSYLFCQTEHV